MLKQEIKRGFSKLSFKIIFLITVIVVLANVINKFGATPRYLEEYMKMSIISPYERFFLFNVEPISNIYVIFLPILAVIVYADSYLEDKKSGFLKEIYTRISKKKYLLNKFISNFIIGGTIFTLPIIINFAVLMLIYPTVPVHPILGFDLIKSGSLLPNLYYSNPILYMLLWFIIYFLFAGAFASIGLAISVFVKNKLSVIVLPFIACNLLGIILSTVDKYSLYPINFLYYSLDQKLSIIVIEFLIMVLTSFLIFFVGGIKSETY